MRWSPNSYTGKYEVIELSFKQSAVTGFCKLILVNISGLIFERVPLHLRAETEKES